MKNKGFFAAFLIFFLFLNNGIYSQINIFYPEEDPDTPKNYELHEDFGIPRFTQKLEWAKVEGIGFYRIEVQEKVSSNYNTIITKDLQENQIVLSLKAGVYRYRILIFNVLDNLERTSSWKTFNVIKALQPELSANKNMVVTIKKDDISKKRSLELSGKNLLMESKFFICEQNKPDKVLSSGSTLSANPNGSSARVSFNFLPLIEELQAAEGKGLKSDSKKFMITVKNPGGLHCALGGFEFCLEEASAPVQISKSESKKKVEEKNPPKEEAKNKKDEKDKKEEDKKLKEEKQEEQAKENKAYSLDFKNPNLDVALGLVFPVQILGAEYAEDKFYKEFFGSNLLFPSFEGKLSYLPVKFDFGRLGLGLIASYSRVKNDVERRFKSYTMQGNIISCYFDAVCQINMAYFSKSKILERLVLEGRSGFGFQSLAGFSYDFETPLGSYSSDTLSGTSFAVNIGSSAQFVIWKELYAELAWDYCYDARLGTGTFEPAILVGWKF